MNDVATPQFSFVTHWQTDAGDSADAVLEFWRHENAIGDEAQSKKRVAEVVVHARDRNGAVAGVATAVPITLPRLAQPMYYYRCFIGKDWRKSRLVFTLLTQAFTVLESYASTHDYPCIGMLLELENSRFGSTLQAPAWTNPKFIFIGKSQRGLDLRVKYFRGAKLKSAKN